DVDEAVTDRLVESQGNEHISRRAPYIFSGQKAAGPGPGGQRLVHQIVSNMAGDFFNEIDLATDIAPKRRCNRDQLAGLRGLPSCKTSRYGADILSLTRQGMGRSHHWPVAFLIGINFEFESP